MSGVNRNFWISLQQSKLQRIKQCGIITTEVGLHRLNAQPERVLLEWVPQLMEVQHLREQSICIQLTQDNKMLLQLLQAEAELMILN